MLDGSAPRAAGGWIRIAARDGAFRTPSRV